VRPYNASRSKYGNRKTVYDGIEFDSRKEALRYRDLELLLHAGEINDLELQVHFELIPAQNWGVRKERAVEYVADFVYRDNTGNKVVEDVKGYRAKEYIIKRKLMKHLHGIEIREV
jgi:hypothetical protein